MTRRRIFLAALLAYVTLDLALPAMPGAFVFDAEDSVEGVDGGRSRLAAETVILPVPGGPSASLSQARLAFRPRRLRPERPAAGCSQVSRLPRATCDPPQSSEDPH